MSRLKRLLVVGGGSIGERHARCFQRTGRVEVELCEPNAAVRAAVVERCELAASYPDFETALTAAPDIAVICTPAQLHVAMALQLVDCNIPVLIEKPLSVTLDGVDQLRTLVRERRSIAAVAYVYRAHPVLARMRQELLSGRFGSPVQLVAVFGQNFPFYRPAYREIYYRDRATGGGAIQDALTHVINAAEWLVGPVTALAADAAHLVLDGVQVEDTVHLIARHGSVLASYSLNQHQAANEGTITVACERGVVRFEMHTHCWRWMTEPGNEWHEEPQASLERDELFVRQAEAFLDAVDDRAAPLCSLEEGVQTLRVNLAALDSFTSRTWKIIPEQGEPA